MKSKGSIIPALVVTLIILQLLVILLSWIVAAAVPSAPVRSLLSDSGIRWMFGSFTDSVTSPLVIWIIIYSMVYGAYRDSGLRNLSLHNLTFRRRLALRTVIIETVMAAVLLLLFTVMPHAVLLSITGTLFTCEFFEGLVPSFAIYLVIVIISYGSITRSFKTVGDVLDSMSRGVAYTSRIWTPYILFMLLVSSVLYVLG